MTSVITKKLKPSIVLNLFEKPELINIRWYDMIETNRTYKDLISNIPLIYELTIRHNEDECPKKLLKRAITNFKT